MSDLIDRQAAINEINEYGSIWMEYTEVMTKDEIAEKALKNAKASMKRIINELPSAQPEQQWIPCSERLPEVSGRYLVTRGLNACGALWNRAYLINYSDLMGLKSERIWWNGNVGKSDFERVDDVIAWMPLPEPYKENSDA